MIVLIINFIKMRKKTKTDKKNSYALIGPSLIVICLLSAAWLELLLEDKVEKDSYFPSCSKNGVVMLDENLVSLQDCSNIERYLLGHKMDFDIINRNELMLLPGIGPAHADSVLALYKAKGKSGPVIFEDLVPGLSKRGKDSLKNWTN